MRPRMGFALVRIIAPRRRQDPRSECEARLEWGPADRRRSLHQHIYCLGEDQNEPSNFPPDMRELRGSLCYRCGWLAPGDRTPATV